MFDEWTSVAPTLERKMEAEGSGNSEGRTYQVNVAPIISNEKVSFALRQMASTLSGGVRVLPGMTKKAYFMQFCLWLLPPALGVVVAVALSSESALLRFLIAGIIAASHVAAVDLFRWYVCRQGSVETTRQNMWFTDYDDVDYSSLLSPATCRAMLPAKRSSLHVVLCWLFSFLLMGTAAGVLNFSSVEEDLGKGFGSWLAVLLSLKCFFTVATAQFGLTTSPPPESTSHRYCDPLTLPGLLEDYSRPLLVIALLSPAFLQLGAAGAWLRVTAALLPVLWAIGVMPQLDTLLSWALDQLEVNIFGGSPVPRDVRLMGAVLASVTATAGIVLISEVSKDANEDLAAVLVLTTGLLFAGLLALLPPRLMDFGHPLLHRLGAVEIQVLGSAGCAIILLLGLGLDDIRASFESDREVSASWMLRLIFEQVAAFLSLGGLYLNTRRLRAGGLRGDFRSGTVAYKPASTAKKPEGLLVGSSARRFFVVIEVVVRVLLLTHAACYGVVALVAADSGFLAFDAAVLLRAWRIVLANPVRAAGDAWIAGILDLILAAAAIDGDVVRWSLGARLLLVSLARQRFLQMLKRAQYAAHLTRVTSKIPKLRHPITGKVLLANAVFFPFLFLVLLLSAVLESPLVALFTLPCFLVGYPRPRHGHPELSPDDTPQSKGVEGIFYSILTPSLLRDLVPRWRYGTLSTQPGMLFFCRSHERLACLVRVLGAGFGWVQVEVRGLEMQEPTSCHHVEAGIIDDAFSLAFKGEALPPPRRQASGQSGPSSAGGHAGSAGETSNGPLPSLFVLQPVCQVRATTYEQTQLSMAGIIDSHDTLRQVHRLFLKTLVWVMAQHRFKGGLIPRAWLSCPVKVRDAQTVLNLLRTSKKWLERVAVAFNTQELLVNAETANIDREAVAATTLAKETPTGRDSPKVSDSGPALSLRSETPTNSAWAEFGRPASPWQDIPSTPGSCPERGREKEVAEAPAPVARVPSPPLAPAPAPVAAVAACRGPSRTNSKTDSDPLRGKQESLAASEPMKAMDMAPLAGRDLLLRQRSGGDLAPLNLPQPKAQAGMAMLEADEWPPLEQAGQKSSPPGRRAPAPDTGCSMPDRWSGLGCGPERGLGHRPQTPTGSRSHRPQTPTGSRSHALHSASESRVNPFGLGNSPSGGLQGVSSPIRDRTSFGGTGIRLSLDEAPPTHAPSSTLPPCKPPVRSSGYSPRVNGDVNLVSPVSSGKPGAPEPPPRSPQEPRPPRSPPDESMHSQAKQEEDLDKLMDMVLDIGPGKKEEEPLPKRSKPRKSKKSPRDRDRSLSPVRGDELGLFDQEVINDILHPLPMKQRELVHQASPSPELEDVRYQDHSSVFAPQPPSRSPPPLSPGPVAAPAMVRRDSQERPQSGAGQRPHSGAGQRPHSGTGRRPSGAGLARTPTPPGITPPTERIASAGRIRGESAGRIRGDSGPAGASVSRKTPSPPAAEPFRPPSTQPACLDDLDPVTALTIQAYVAVDVAPAYGQSPEALGPNHVFKAYTGKFGQASQAEVEWLLERPELIELTVRAFRYAWKITVDCIAMAEDAAAMDDEELETELRELDGNWYLGDDCSQAWQAAMEERRPHLMALRRPQGTSSGFQVLRLNLQEDDVSVAELRPEVVQSIWASQSLELRYFTNDDDERYSIQAHPTLLRNMIVQSAEYPIFVSPPTTVWL